MMHPTPKLTVYLSNMEFIIHADKLSFILTSHTLILTAGNGAVCVCWDKGKHFKCTYSAGLPSELSKGKNHFLGCLDNYY